MDTRRLTALGALFGAALLLTPACTQTEQEVDRTAKAVTTAVPRAEIKVELTLVRGLVQNHRRLHQSWPSSLAATDALPRLKHADDYAYDPETGEVTSRTYPGL